MLSSAIERLWGWGTVRQRFAVAWVVSVVAVLGLLLVAALTHRPGVTALAGGVLVLVSWVVRPPVRAARRQHPGLSLVVASLVLATGTGVAAAFFFAGDDSLDTALAALGLGGLAVAYLGLGQVAAGIRALPVWSSPARRRGPLLACAALTAVGLLGATLTAAPAAAALAVAGVLATPVALMVLTRGSAAEVARRPGWAVAAALGLGGLAWLAVCGVAPLFLGLVALVVLGLVLAIVSETDVDILIVVVALAVAWALVPRQSAVPEAIRPAAGDTVLVAVGDSYMSGEGDRTFLPGTNDGKGSECRRSANAYPVTVLPRLRDPDRPTSVAFLACSGAVARHLADEAQEPGDRPLGEEGEAAARAGDRTAGGPVEGSQLWYLESLLAQEDRGEIDVPLVLVSIGGNDARFGEVGRLCVAPGDCSTLGQYWLDHLHDIVEPRLAEAYRAVAALVAGRARVAVVPYPVPLTADGCPASLLTDREHRFLHGFVEELDAVVARTARSAGLEVVDTMPGALRAAGQRVCDTQPDRAGINFLAANPVEGLLRQQVSPLSWFHNSLHPNATGHATMAAALAEWMEGPGAPVAPPGGPAAGDRSLQEVMGAGASFVHCAEFDHEVPSCRTGRRGWLTAQLTREAWFALPGALLLVAGAWLAALHLLAARRRWVDQRRPAAAAATSE